MEAPDNLKPDNITWVVHPFYFEACTNIVNLDWEHDRYEWINPEQIEKVHQKESQDSKKP